MALYLSRCALCFVLFTTVSFYVHGKEVQPLGLKTSGFPMFTNRATKETVPISKAPPPFVHPRLYFLKEELPGLRKLLLDPASIGTWKLGDRSPPPVHGSAGFKQLKDILLGSSKEKWTSSDKQNTPLFKGPYKELYEDLRKAPKNAGAIDISPSGLRKYGANVFLHASNVAENGFGHVGLYGKLSGAAFVSLITDGKEDPFIGVELGQALGATCRNHRPIWKDKDGREFGFFHDSPDDLGIAYDWLYNDMSDSDRAECRSLIAMMTGKNRREFGAQYIAFPWSGFNWNWLGWHETIVVLATSIAGEDKASDSDRWADDCHLVQSRYFLTESSEAGLAIEGLGYHTLGLNGALTATMINARSRENLFEAERTRNALYRMALYRIYTAEPWIDQLPDNLTKSDQDAFSHGDAPGRHRPRSAIVLRKYFPTDPLVAWAFKNAGDIPHQEPLMSAIMATNAVARGKYDKLEEIAETVGLPVNYFCRDRGEMIVRDHWRGDATVFDFETKMNGLSLGHNHADRNSFYLYARGRAWIIDNHYGDVENAAHQTVLIDGIGQGGGATPRGADTFPAMPGVFLEYSEGVNGGIEYVSGVGDAKAAYDYSASCQPEAIKDGYKCGKSPYKRRDFVYPPAPYLNEPKFDGLSNNWMDEDKANQRLLRDVMTFNPVLKAFRSTIYVKATNPTGVSSPWMLIVDDIQKDNSEHKYEFVMNLPWAENGRQWQYRHNHEQVVKDDDETAALKADTDVVLKDERDPAGSGPRLLVRVLKANGLKPGGIKYYARRPLRTRKKITKDSFRNSRHLVIETTTVSPDFMVFLYPYNYGDVLPVTKFTGKTLSVSISGVAETKWTVSKLDSGRTRLSPSDYGANANTTAKLKKTVSVQSEIAKINGTNWTNSSSELGAPRSSPTTTTESRDPKNSEHNSKPFTPTNLTTLANDTGKSTGTLSGNSNPRAEKVEDVYRVTPMPKSDQNSNNLSSSAPKKIDKDLATTIPTNAAQGERSSPTSPRGTRTAPESKAPALKHSMPAERHDTSINSPRPSDNDTSVDGMTTTSGDLAVSLVKTEPVPPKAPHRTLRPTTGAGTRDAKVHGKENVTSTIPASSTSTSYMQSTTPGKHSAKNHFETRKTSTAQKPSVEKMKTSVPLGPPEAGNSGCNEPHLAIIRADGEPYEVGEGEWLRDAEEICPAAKFSVVCLLPPSKKKRRVSLVSDGKLVRTETEAPYSFSAKQGTAVLPWRDYPLRHSFIQLRCVSDDGFDFSVHVRFSCEK